MKFNAQAGRHLDGRSGRGRAGARASPGRSTAPAITFKLRPGVKFYPTGNPMTAEDVRYSFERLTRIVGNGRNQAGIAGLFKAEQVEVGRSDDGQDHLH